jgi:hypothetical protein
MNLLARLPEVKLLTQRSWARLLDPVPTDLTEQEYEALSDLERQVLSEIRQRRKATTESLERHRDSPQRVFPPKKERKKPHRHEVGEGYDQLPEPYLTYYQVAKWFAKMAKADDQEDLLHDILIRLYQAGEQLASRGQPFSYIAQVRTAEHTKDDYWYEHYAYYYGLECKHCSTEERAKCRKLWKLAEWAYCDCQKYVELASLYEPVTDEEGQLTELGEVIADDKAVDLAEWLDARLFLLHSPIKLKLIAVKRYRGQPLKKAEQKYLERARKHLQLSFDVAKSAKAEILYSGDTKIG